MCGKNGNFVKVTKNLETSANEEARGPLFLDINEQLKCVLGVGG